MQLSFLGVGSAFSLENYQSNMLLDVGGKKLLIDAGSDLRHALHEQGLSQRDIHAVYISHLHTDHMGAMEFLALATKYDPRFEDDAGNKRKLAVYLKSSLRAGLWDTLKHGCPIQGEEANLGSYFDVHACKGRQFSFQGTTFELVRTVHFMNNTDIAPSYGLRWRAPNGKRVLLTTDTQLTPYFKVFYQQSDLIFQDCETTKFPTGVHAHYTELVALPADVKRKMWLYHYQDGEKPDATADGFAGWVRQGQTFNLSE